MVKKNQKNLQDIIDVVQRLRHPKKGCPWDIEQTSKSLSKYTLEEAYEVVEAIEKNNYTELEDELGDLLLQVIYHSVIACLLYTSPSPRDLSTSRMPSSA